MLSGKSVIVPMTQHVAKYRENQALPLLQGNPGFCPPLSTL